MEVPTPSDNPITAGKIKLGEQLFFDKRLSKAKNMSCETCHVPEKGWTDGLPFSKKFDGTLNTRHTPTLFGVAFYPELYWDGRAQGLEALVPDVMKSQMGADPEAVAKELGTVPAYKSAFEAELGGPPTADRIAKALATFVRTIHAGDTPFDNLPEGTQDDDRGQGLQGVLGGDPLHALPPASPLLGHALPQHGRRIGPREPRSGALQGRGRHRRGGGQARSARGGGADGSLQDPQPAGPAAHGPRTSTMAGRRRTTRPPGS